jgi:autoinducer 2-degrading protein
MVQNSGTQLTNSASGSTLVQSIHYTFGPEDADRAVDILRELQGLSRQEPGIVSFSVTRSKERPNVFVLWEEYRDEAALQAHLKTEHFKRLVVDGIRRLAKERLAEALYPLE